MLLTAGQKLKKVSHKVQFRSLSCSMFLFMTFLFYKKCDLYNFAVDNTLSFHSPDFDKIINVLEDESKTFIGWFRFNCKQANPNKF